MNRTSMPRPGRRGIAVGAVTAAALVVAAGAAQAAPVNQAPPTIRGGLAAGTAAVCNPGTWAGATRFEYTWYRGAFRADRRIDGQARARLLIDRPAHAGKLACQVTAFDAAGGRTSASSAERSTVRGNATVRVTRVVPLPGIVRVPNPPFRLQRMRVEGIVGPALLPGWMRFAYQRPNPELGSIYISRGRNSILPRGVSRVPVRNAQGRFQAIVHTTPGRFTMQVMFTAGTDWNAGRLNRQVVLPAS